MKTFDVIAMVSLLALPGALALMPTDARADGWGGRLWSAVAGAAQRSNFKLQVEYDPVAGAPEECELAVAVAVRTAFDANLRTREKKNHTLTIAGHATIEPTVEALRRALAPMTVELRPVDEVAMHAALTAATPIPDTIVVDRTPDPTLSARTNGLAPTRWAVWSANSLALRDFAQNFANGAHSDWSIYRRTDTSAEEWELLPVGPPAVTAKDMASVRWGEDSAHMPNAQVVLTKDGKSRFAALTTAQVRQRIAIVVGGELSSAPVVMEPIGGGRLQISFGASGSEMDHRAQTASLGMAASRCVVRLDTVVLSPGE